ncbi:uncharacterized protein LOC123910202 [Trifolium pratense]|uniref:uncharacterized protein LOC123910202 n=1 Tax=Trifolium pratense TaxID=57577 RepID=UPI001E695065|nr:uncharacterized protein LOC123910202 [Trifolium pratense]
MKYNIVILLLWSFFAASVKLEAQAWSLSEVEIQAKLKLLNKPAVKTIKSKDGDIIDCVSIYKQPAFDHPILKNHKIQKIPTFFQESQYSSEKHAFKENIEVFQTWQKSGNCPNGTVPIRRILKNDLLRAASVDHHFGLKPPPLFVNSTNTNFSESSSSFAVISENHSGVHIQSTSGSGYIGAQGDINTWNPKVQLAGDSTTAQMWLKSGNGFDFESIEAGWTVNPTLYGNNDTRLFSYWTKDSYKSTGCYDLTCSGFVQTSNVITLGAALIHVSTDSGPQTGFTVKIFLDELGHWWLSVANYNTSIVIGYWPVELFASLQHSASVVQWGGQVISSQLKHRTPHTKTEMGSGHLADGGYGHSCFINSLRVKDYSQMLKYPESTTVAAQEPNCYNFFNDVKDGQEPAFYFGGPGPSCV